jgi:hypothetical protein
MRIVIAGRELCHKANPLEVPAAGNAVATFEQIASVARSAQDRDSSTRNYGLIVGLFWHMIAAFSPRGIRT